MGGFAVGTARAVGLLLGILADEVVDNPRRRRGGKGFGTAAGTSGRGAYADRQRVDAAVIGVVTGASILFEKLSIRTGLRRAPVRALGVAVGTWAVLGGARVAAAGTDLARGLETGDLAGVRRMLSTLDTRCTEDLDAAELSRASVEAVAGQTSQTVVAPLMWTAVAGTPGLLGLQAVTALHELVQREGLPYRFGRFTARLDRAVHVLPSRAAAALIATGAPIVGGSSEAAWQAWRRDTILHPHPNSGRVAAAFAGALNVRLGGRTAYPHGVEELPMLGDGRNPDGGHVTRAAELSRVVGWLAGATSIGCALLGGLFRRGSVRCRRVRCRRR